MPSPVFLPPFTENNAITCFLVHRIKQGSEILITNINDGKFRINARGYNEG